MPVKDGIRALNPSYYICTFSTSAHSRVRTSPSVAVMRPAGTAASAVQVHTPAVNAHASTSHTVLHSANIRSFR